LASQSANLQELNQPNAKQLLQIPTSLKTSGVKNVSQGIVPSVSLRRYLYFTAGVTGAAVMIVEILGAKMLSPYVGMSHFVWTAQIAVTLVALACGYYAGGRLADRSQKLAALYWALFGAAIWLSGTVIICEPVAYFCLDFNLAVGALMASTILFFIPLALLAMTGPFLVRVITSSVTSVGANVGRLISISTLGSFAGTLLIGYFMIPFLANSMTMYLTSVILAMVCLGYFAFYGRQLAAPILIGLVLFSYAGLKLRLGLTHNYQWVEERFFGNSHFGQLQVLDARVNGRRYYLNDFLTQNTYDPETRQSTSHFTYMLSGLARAYTANINDVLCIGLGVGIVPMDFARDGARVDVVEINPSVVPVAEKYFNLDPKLIRLTIDDGRHFLNRCRKQYDAVVLDAFLGDSSPSHLFTREAFTSIRQVLRPGGTLVINSFGDLMEGRDFFTSSLYDTLKSVFPGVRIHSNGDGGIFFAAGDRDPLRFVHPPDLQHVHADVLQDTKDTYAGLRTPAPHDGRILTDDFNPAEFYDARNREQLRRKLAMGAKDM
jgi:predicted membrane-bound spermidine synthase